MNLVCRVATFGSFVVHQVLDDFILVSLNHIRDSTVSYSEYATSIASRCVSERTRYAKILQVSDLLLNDIDAATNIARSALDYYLGLHWLLLLLLGHATL